MDYPFTNKKIIVIAGMSRGGTNLLWNIVQSHPAIIDSFYELNEIFARKTAISLIGKARIEMEALGGVPIPGVSKLVKERLARFSKKSFQEDQFNREKSPGINYEAADLASLTVCTKLVSAWETDPLRMLLKRNDALKYIPILERSFSEIKVIFLVRNGLAVAEGWGRRGADISTAARWYGRYVCHYEYYVAKHPGSSMIVRFEDLLADPFETAEQVYRLLSLEDTKLEHLRIAIKPTIRSNQEIANTTQKAKVWINRNNYREHLDVAINSAQIEKIHTEDQARFINMNRKIMERYGYI